MRVLIFEPRYKGHHFMYVRRLLDALAGLASEIIIATEPASAQSIEFHQHLDDASTPYRLYDRLTPAPVASKQHFWQQHLWLRLGQLRDAISELRPDHVYIPTADGLASLTGVPFIPWWFHLSRHIPIEANLLRCAFAYPTSEGKQRLKYRLLRATAARSCLTQLHTLDFIARENLQRLHPALAQRLSILPDPLDPVPSWPKIQARRELGLPEEGRYIGSVGTFEPRKGIEPLLAAFVKATADEGDRMLLVGKFDAAIRRNVDERYAELRRTKRLFLMDEYVTDRQLSMALSAMDVVAAPYVRHIGPSGIVLRALAAGRRVLVSDYGWCGQVVPRFDLGWACDTQNEAVFTASIQQALRQVDAGEFTLTPLQQKLLRFSSPDNFAMIWRARLRARLGLPTEQDLLEWHEVVAGMESAPVTGLHVGTKSL